MFYILKNISEIYFGYFFNFLPTIKITPFTAQKKSNGYFDFTSQ